VKTPPYEPAFNVVLHQPEIPGNTGAVGRSCVAFTAKLWLIRPLGFRIDEKSLKRAGLDYWDDLVWEVVDDWASLERRAAESTVIDPARFWMFTRTARQFVHEVRFCRGDWLVFGSETSGLPPSLLADAGRNLRIPVSPLVRSLNLSSAAAISCFELSRQLALFAGDV
jgi:tRNA (cytidine/uridine-2'-O-)-methyltransferase